MDLLEEVVGWLKKVRQGRGLADLKSVSSQLHLIAVLGGSSPERARGLLLEYIAGAAEPERTLLGVVFNLDDQPRELVQRRKRYTEQKSANWRSVASFERAEEQAMRALATSVVRAYAQTSQRSSNDFVEPASTWILVKPGEIRYLPVSKEITGRLHVFVSMGKLQIEVLEGGAHDLLQIHQEKKKDGLVQGGPGSACIEMFTRHGTDTDRPSKLRWYIDAEMRIDTVKVTLGPSSDSFPTWAWNEGVHIRNWSIRDIPTTFNLSALPARSIMFAYFVAPEGPWGGVDDVR